MIGNPDDAVGLGEGGDASGAPGKRNGDDPLIDFPELDAEKFLNPQFRGDFSYGHNRNRGALRLGLTDHRVIRGPTSCSYATMADTGYPGIPNTGFLLTTPIIRGFPGIMVTP